MGVVAAEGGGVELQWLIGPLTGVTGRVQYPLATPSRACLSKGTIAEELFAACDL
jgi:hypothetical protein